MNLLDIFNEIVNIMQNDYSGCRIKKTWSDPKKYKQKLVELQNRNMLTRERYKEIVDDYLLDYKDNHVIFLDKNSKDNNFSFGFSVRRFENKLYVQNVWEEKTGIKKGDAIIELDGQTIDKVAQNNLRLLFNQSNERQLWKKVLAKFESCLVEHENGDKIQIKLKKYPPYSERSKYTCELINENTVLMVLDDFMNYNEIHELMDKSEELLTSTKNLIIDVRKNNGGYDSLFYPLLEYIFPCGFILKDDNDMFFLHTERNYKNRTKMINEYLKENDDEIIRNFIKELDINRGKGFVIDSECGKEYIINGRKGPEKVIVMIDRYCGSSGDSFADICKKSPKITLIGRATFGVIDYSNVAEEEFEDEFSLMYPTSVMDSVKYGKGIDNIGVQPDIYIPWTPEHIKRDVDLEKAMELLK